MKILLSCTDTALKEISVFLHMSLQLWVLYMTYCTVCHNIKFNHLVEFSCRPDNFTSCCVLYTGRKGVQGAQPGPVLDWMQRVRIAVDAARGLEYLHEKVQPSIIHRDVRSSNVLLFEEYKTKIADFNLSNQAPDMAARLHSTRVLGTFGYHAPE